MKGYIVVKTITIMAKRPIPDVISMKEVLDLSYKLAPNDQILYLILYLTGARIGEVLRLQVRDINISDEFMTFNIYTEKNRRHPIREIPVRIRANTANPETVMADIIIEGIANKSPDTYLFNISRYLAHKRINKLSIVTKATIGNERLEYYELKIYPHYLRHCRLTHLRQLYAFDALAMMQFAGWSNVAPTRIYVHSGVKDLMKLMV